MPPVVPIHLDLEAIPFVRARNFGRSNRRPDLIVLHSAENQEKAGAARRLADWAAGPNAPMASWHYSVDAQEIVQSVRLEDVAWHAPGANSRGIGIEMTGRAAQGQDEWSDIYSRSVIDRTVLLCAALCRKFDIPADLVIPDALKLGGSGITTHAFVTKAFGKSTHTDPGPNFPLVFFVSRVARELA